MKNENKYRNFFVDELKNNLEKLFPLGFLFLKKIEGYKSPQRFSSSEFHRSKAFLVGSFYKNISNLSTRDEE